MDVIELLESQHDELKDLFERIEAAKLRRERLALFRQIADTFAAHCAVEERLFYPGIYNPELKDLLMEAVEEHLAAKRIIADLLALGDAADDDVFKAKVTVLKETIEHHVDKEEGAMFEPVREMMSDKDLDTYGAQLEALFQELMQEEPRKQVPREIEEAAPLPT